MSTASTPSSSGPGPGSGPSTLGVDAGASLWKVAFGQGTSLETEMFASGDVAAIKGCIERWRPERVVLTGGGSARIEAELQVDLEIQVRKRALVVDAVPEFEAWWRGAPILARRHGVELPPAYLLVSLGTGTSVQLANGEGSRRVGGTALGGGTLLGLGRLLLDTGEFDRIVDLAEHGDRRQVDLLVGDIYPEGATPLPRDLNASSFAKLDSREPPDLALALMGLVGENVSLICGALAGPLAAQRVVYCGSTLTNNPPLRRILEGTTSVFGVEVCFLDQGAFCGAVGAASSPLGPIGA